jgi:hypothetical protein
MDPNSREGNMFFKSRKSIIVRFVLILMLLGGMSGITDARAAGNPAPDPVIVTVQDTDGAPVAGLNVYAFAGATYTGLHGVTAQNGQVTLLLPEGAYRFRADLNGTQFWSGITNHCDIPGCLNAGVMVTVPVTVMIQDAGGTPKSGVNVYAFNGSTYTGYSKVSNAAGDAVFTLPVGSYRFRADYSGTQYWSGTANHCTLPGCSSASVTVGPAVPATATATQTATSTPTLIPSVTPSYTPTTTPTAVLGCNGISDSLRGVADPIKFYGNTMYLDIPNPNAYPVAVRDVFVAWNYQTGGSVMRSLTLQSARLNTNVFWTGSVSAYNLVIGEGGYPFSQPVILPAGQTSRLTFSFDRNYANPIGDEIMINFSTPGCEPYPIDVVNQ